MLAWVELVTRFWEFKHIKYLDSLSQIIDDFFHANDFDKRKARNGKFTRLGFSDFQRFHGGIEKVEYFFIVDFKKADGDSTVLFGHLFIEHSLKGPGQNTPLVCKQRDFIILAVRVDFRTISDNGIGFSSTCLATKYEKRLTMQK